MTGTELAVRYTASDGVEINLTPNVVMNYLLGGKQVNITQDEMARTIMKCRARNLNPFTDVIAQPHRNKDGTTSISLVATKEYFSRNAVNNPRYEGMSAGIVVNVNGNFMKKQGSACYPGEILVGGWCAVYVKGYERPIYAEVSLEEYDTGLALWKTKKATMIRKVAVSQALREAFPEQFGGIYEPEEMGIDEPEQELQPVYEDAPMYQEHEQTESLMGEGEF